ncbi:hypothetical protein TEQG_02682 [Trichophyton equinum CBS 127.97]|uniref:Uncharacterized protein n=1 Tax=Trichophyton equinum (strain ATCC MYA-4606 / CBS 127.97) TaxID=559882 RepID=F2PP33_TRIEC|nr:hypothetical protein TEQG_02682 [Trichophyton equinum CBS 127.97]
MPVTAVKRSQGLINQTLNHDLHPIGFCSGPWIDSNMLGQFNKVHSPARRRIEASEFDAFGTAVTGRGRLVGLMIAAGSRNRNNGAKTSTGILHIYLSLGEPSEMQLISHSSSGSKTQRSRGSTG